MATEDPSGSSSATKGPKRNCVYTPFPSAQQPRNHCDDQFPPKNSQKWNPTSANECPAAPTSPEGVHNLDVGHKGQAGIRILLIEPPDTTQRLGLQIQFRHRRETDIELDAANKHPEVVLLPFRIFGRSNPRLVACFDFPIFRIVRLPTPFPHTPRHVQPERLRAPFWNGTGLPSKPHLQPLPPPHGDLWWWRPNTTGRRHESGVKQRLARLARRWNHSICFFVFFDEEKILTSSFDSPRREEWPETQNGKEWNGMYRLRNTTLSVQGK